MEDQILTSTDLATRLSCSPRSLRRVLERAGIPYRIGGDARPFTTLSAIRRAILGQDPEPKYPGEVRVL